MQNTCCCFAEPPRICRWISCHLKDATLELRWTEPKTCGLWSPYKNANDGYHPGLCAATRKADVSTKVGQSSLHWSKHIANTATTFCPRCCFLVTPLRHRLDCSVFCDRSLQCKHRFATVFPEQKCTVCKTRFFQITARFFRLEFKKFCASWQVFGLAVMLAPAVSSLSVARNHRPSRSATRSSGLPALQLSDKCQVTRDTMCVAACLGVGRAKFYQQVRGS